VLGTSPILAAGTATQKSDLLPRIAASDLLIAFAHAERSARLKL
jgi:hypothetical protein